MKSDCSHLLVNGTWSHPFHVSSVAPTKGLGTDMCSRNYSVMGTGTESRENGVMVKTSLLHPSLKRRSWERTSDVCHWRTEACPLPLSKREPLQPLDLFLLVTKRLYMGVSTTWWMVSLKSVFLPQRKHQSISWHIVTPRIQFIKSLTLKIVKCYPYQYIFIMLGLFSLLSLKMHFIFKHWHEVEGTQKKK